MGADRLEGSSGPVAPKEGPTTIGWTDDSNGKGAQGFGLTWELAGGGEGSPMVVRGASSCGHIPAASIFLGLEKLDSGE